MKNGHCSLEELEDRCEGQATPTVINHLTSCSHCQNRLAELKDPLTVAIDRVANLAFGSLRAEMFANRR